MRTQNSEGLLLIDSRASSIRSHLQDGRVMAIHREYLQGIKREPGGTCIVEYPVFVQSQFFGAVQLADLCAYQLFHASQTNPNIQDICSLEPNDGNLRLVLKLLKETGGCQRLP